ncbi:GNAT family N-acetyltransferase [Nocardia flavorosea]|uniref:GNAT family N-acetyltransferase n=1 Tax=Nocardia flavorosea TaxID=53429 RepID=UPI00189432E2|nr:GNAT family N-acetyltransferase [Nocardia flavorosea]MBF6352006.1 GNAT family N-acetyltransferase [Nocardia flavorosea]
MGDRADGAAGCARRVAPGHLLHPHTEAALWNEQQWREWTARRCPFFVAVTGARPVGSAGVIATEGGPELVSMWTAVPARRTGVSDQLVHAVAEWARGAGHRELRLWVLDGNQAAEKLYLRNGFLRTGAVRPCSAEDLRPENEMALSLSPVPAARRSEPSSPTIRPYRPEDEEAVVGLWSRASRIAHPFIANEGAGERERKLREIYLVEADNWVAENPAGGVVGLMGLLGSEIGGLFVDPGAQKMGIGKQLVAHALRLHGRVTLDVFELNTAARAFYARLGFREIGRHPESDTGFTAITLELTA